MKNESIIGNYTGGWNSINQLQNHILFSICILASILHFNIWLQLIMQKVKIDFSLIFLLTYMLADVLLLLCYFIEYSIRSRSWITITTGYCYFETYAMLFLNVYESYSLTALNIGRYLQIVRNQNIYVTYRRTIFLSSILIAIWILLNFLIQDLLNWCQVTSKVGISCFPTYRNRLIQTWNLLVILILPIIISFSMLYRSLYYLQNSYAQQIMIRRNHHRKLIVYTCIFYSIWLCLWLPFIMITYLNIKHINGWIVFIANLGNIIQILSDSMIIYFLDKRFAQILRKFLRFNVQVHPHIFYH